MICILKEFPTFLTLGNQLIGLKPIHSVEKDIEKETLRRITYSQNNLSIENSPSLSIERGTLKLPPGLQLSNIMRKIIQNVSNALEIRSGYGRNMDTEGAHDTTRAHDKHFKISFSGIVGAGICPAELGLSNPCGGPGL